MPWGESMPRPEGEIMPRPEGEIMPRPLGMILPLPSPLVTRLGRPLTLGISPRLPSMLPRPIILQAGVEQWGEQLPGHRAHVGEGGPPGAPAHPHHAPHDPAPAAHHDAAPAGGSAVLAPGAVGQFVSFSQSVPYLVVYAPRIPLLGEEGIPRPQPITGAAGGLQEG